MRLTLPAMLFAALALAQPSATFAQPEPTKVDLRPAFIVEEGIGDAVVYLSDTFRKSAPLAPEPLHVITIQRSNPGDALNSPADDMNALQKYLRTKGGLKAEKMVATVSSRDIVRVFFQGDAALLQDGFDYPRATLRGATPADWTRLRAISIPDFSRYLAKNATRLSEGLRWALGDHVPLAKGRPVELGLRIETGGADKGRALGATLKRKRFESATQEVALSPGGDRIAVLAKLPFSEESFQRLMNTICEEAAKGGGECTEWTMKFEPVKLAL